MQRHDLIVIGGGAGGIAAADAAVRRGADVALVHDGPIGGDCTWTGCVPSKALIYVASVGGSADEGLREAGRAIRQIAATEGPDVFRDRGVTVRNTRVRFRTSTSLETSDGDRIEAPRVVIATGAAPLVPPIDGLREATPLTTDTLWELGALPSSLAVLGGGPIGAELAQALSRLGIRVTVFEALDRILVREEAEAAGVVGEALRRDGVDLRVGAAVERVERRPTGEVEIHASGGAPVVADDLLVAVGRRPVTDGLDLGNAGVEVGGTGHVVTDDRMATTAPGIYAVGDVTGRFPFTHGAHAQALVAVSNALGRFSLRRFSTRSIPAVTFTDPEVARAGLTEAEAHERWGADARVVELALAGVDRAIIEDRTDGFVKLVAAPGRLLGHRAGGQLVGATVVAPHAGELIHELSLAMRLRVPPAALAMATHAYPTWGVAVQQAASGFFLDLEEGEVRPARASV